MSRAMPSTPAGWPWASRIGVVTTSNRARWWSGGTDSQCSAVAGVPLRVTAASSAASAARLWADAATGDSVAGMASPPTASRR